MSDTHPIFEIREGNYEWTTFVVYPHPVHHSRYVVFSQNGCSCTSFTAPNLDVLTAAEPLSRAETHRRLTSYLDGVPHYINKGSAVRYLEQFEITMAGISG